jgi:uncharacterized protein with GYD domain
MATYIVLINIAGQGMRNTKQIRGRIKTGTAALKKLGIKIKDIYWTWGAYDAVLVADATNDEAITTWTSSQGNLHTETIPTFSADEMKKILTKTNAHSLSSCESIQWSY